MICAYLTSIKHQCPTRMEVKARMRIYKGNRPVFPGVGARAPTANRSRLAQSRSLYGVTIIVPTFKVT